MKCCVEFYFTMKTEKKKKRKLGLGGCAHQYVLGSQTSHCAQVSGIKDMEKGIKKYIYIYSVGAGI